PLRRAPEGLGYATEAGAHRLPTTSAGSTSKMWTCRRGGFECGSITQLSGRLLEGPPKSRAGRRSVPIPERLVLLLERRIEGRTAGHTYADLYDSDLDRVADALDGLGG